MTNPTNTTDAAAAATTAETPEAITTTQPHRGDEGAAEAPQPENDGSGDTEDTEGDPRVAEARRYRKRAQAAEAERDSLAERLTGLQRAEAERLAGEHIVKGAALWATGIDVADVLDEAGQVDPEKVAVFAAQARESLGVEAPRRRPRPNPAQSQADAVIRPNADAEMASIIAGRSV